MKTKKLSHNWPLIAAILLPILMIIGVTLSLLIPNLLIQPKYDFIFSTTSDVSTDGTYTVENNKLIKQSSNYQSDGVDYSYNTRYSYAQQYPDLYRYDVAHDTDQKISFSEAAALSLSNSHTSPDGFSLKQASSYSNGIWFFGGSSGDNGWYLQKGLASHKIDAGDNSTDSFTFLGWVQ